MIMAMGAIVVIAGIMAMSLSLTTQTSKRTTDIYLYEQANIYSKSAAEFTLLNIANNLPCVEPAANLLNLRLDNLYDLNITLQYIYSEAATCANPPATGTPYFNVSTPEQNGSVLMDITVSSDAGTEPIRIFRRTIQKL